MKRAAFISAARRRMTKGVKSLACAVLRAFEACSYHLTFNLSRQAGLKIKSPARLSQFTAPVKGCGLRKMFSLLVILLLAPPAAFAATPAGTLIINTATAQFSMYSSAPV